MASASSSCALKLVKQTKCFGGWVKQFTHASTSTKTNMTFSVFLPLEAETKRVPVLYFLSGLTCTDDNVMTKSGIQRAAAKHGIAIVAPDTSPRGDAVKEVAHPDEYDMGEGAGFYVDATEPQYKEHFNMYSYVVKELPDLITSNFNVSPTLKSVFGHSMGGHGALVTAMKNPGMFTSCSAFSPICNPSACPWGVKAFTGYIGSDQTKWAKYDASKLIEKYSGPLLPVLCDQGTADDFLAKDQLQPGTLVSQGKGNDHVRLEMRMQDGYDHSYYFISTFMQDHIDFHAKHFAKASK